MTDSEFSTLLAHLFEGTLPSEDAALLQKEFERNPARFNEAAEQFALHQLLAARAVNAAQFADRIQSSLQGAQASASNIRRLESAVMQRVKTPAPATVKPGKARRRIARLRTAGSPQWAAAGLAAALLIGVFAYWYTAERLPAPRLTAVSGQVELLHNATAVAQLGSAVPDGATLRCAEGASATIAFADGTTVKIESNSQATISQGRSKLIQLVSGTVEADVRPQPQHAPLLLRTSNATATVLGTRLRLTFSAATATRLDVLTGKVKLQRNSDNSSVMVASGFTAVAKADQPLIATPLPPVYDGKQPLVLEAETFGNGADAKIANGPTKQMFRERPPNGGPPSANWAVAVPGDGAELTGTVSLRPGRYVLWVRWRDEKQGTISFDVLIDGKLAGSIIGRRTTNDWNWSQFRFETQGETRITLRSTYEGLPVSREVLFSKNYWGPQHPYDAVNRWDQLQISSDPQYRPE